MRRKIFELIFVIMFLFITTFNMIGLAVESFGYDMEDLPTGKLLHPVLSPDTTMTLQIYLVDIEGIGSGIRGEIVSQDNTVRKNIYWETNTSTAIGGWIDETTVSINGHEVNINGDPYDSRRQISLPEASAKNRSKKSL